MLKAQHLKQRRRIELTMQNLKAAALTLAIGSATVTPAYAQRLELRVRIRAPLPKVRTLTRWQRWSC